MKKMIISFAAVVLFMAPVVLQAQTEEKAGKKEQEIKIATNLHCESCKAKIESDLAYVKGVKEVNADVATKVVTVKFSTKKTSAEAIVERIQKLGYQAKVMGDGCCPGTTGGSGCKGSGSGEGSGSCKGQQGSGDHSGSCKGKQGSGEGSGSQGCGGKH